MIAAPYTGRGAMSRQHYNVYRCAANQPEDVLASTPDEAAEAWCKARLCAEDGPVYVTVEDPHMEPPFNRNVYEVTARVEVTWDARHLG